MKNTLGLLFAGSVLLSACNNHLPDSTSASKLPVAPVAAVRPQPLTEHGNTRIDNYFWLRDDSRSSPEVIGYLEAENRYTDQVLAHASKLQESIFQELVARLPARESSVPYREGDYWYYQSYTPGQEYPVYRRRQGGLDGAEEVLLDTNLRAADQEFYEIGELAISPNGKWLAFTEDTRGRNEYVLHIKNLDSGEILDESVTRVAPGIAWANDNQNLFYMTLQPVTLIANQLWQHRVGSPASADQLRYEETNPEFFAYLTRARSGEQIMLNITQTLSDEVRLIDANKPDAPLRTALPREPDHKYLVQADGDQLYILTNWKAPNYRLMVAPLASSADKSSWSEILGHRNDAYLDSFAIFDNYIAIQERSKGMLRLRVLGRSSDVDYYLAASEDAFTMQLDNNPNLDSDLLRYRYTSMTTPATVYDFNMKTRAQESLKQDKVVGDFDPARYTTQRLHIAARDGTQVPVTLYYRNGVTPDGSNPIFILGYGSYGISYDPEFVYSRLSLVDRGFVFALAHIRGGGTLGKQWYEDGKLLNKKNTFTAFIDVTEGLLAQGWGAADKVVASGRSAGGLLMGAVANMRPDLFTIIDTAVPFVDVITTMLDASIPLTTFEFDEWGNPKNKQQYDYMLSYSPYDQVSARDYPPIFVSSGFYDAAVQYFEPAKWVAKLRALKTDNKRLLFKTDMKAGHSGASGRYQQYRDTALEYTFIFDTLGIDTDARP